MKKISQFLGSVYFIILINIITIIFWKLEKPLIAYFIYLFFAILIIVTNTKRIALSSIILSAIINFQGDNDNYLNLHHMFAKMFIPLGLILIALFIYDLIKRKITFKFDLIFFGYLGLLGVNLLSLINIRGEELLTVSILGVLQLLGYLLLYFYMYHSKDEDSKDYLSMVALILGLAISVELFIHYMEIGGVTGKVDHDLTWGVSNSIAMFYLVLIPIGLYSYLKNQDNFIALLISGINFLIMLFMLSRGAYLTIVILIIPFVIFLFKYVNNKKIFIIDTLTAIVLCIIFGLVISLRFGLYDAFKEYITNIDFHNDSGRKELYIIGIDLFKKYPIFGAGSYSGAYYLRDYSLGTYHNYIIQTIATTGIVGLLALGYFIYAVIKKSIFKSKYNLLVLFSFLCVLIHGFVDNSFYNPIIMTTITIILPLLDSQENVQNIEL